MGKLIHQKVLFTFERVFRDPSGFALLSHLPLQGRQEVCLLIASKEVLLALLLKELSRSD